MATAVLANFNYLEPFSHPVKQPVPFNPDWNLGIERSNIKRLAVSDVRSVDVKAKGLTIEEAGFQYVKHQSRFLERVQREGINLSDHTQISEAEWKDGYGAEAKEVVQRLYPDRKIEAFYILGHVVRVSEPETTPGTFYTKNKAAGVASRVHIDLARKGAHAWVGLSGQQALEDAIKPGKRLVWFSLWRPLKTVHRDPLGVVDARTVDPSELVRMERPFEQFQCMGEAVICGPKPDRSLGHKWYYMSEQTPEDVLVLKLYDSKDDSWEESPEADGARLLSVLHAAFQLENSNHLPGRESVEYRVAIVIDE